MEFSVWDESIQEHPDQKKRFESALTGKLIPLSVDFENQTGIFNGSGKEPYSTTLEDCNCSDFKRRKLPCKHMYRLAIELNLIDIDKTSVVSGSYGNDEKTLKVNAKKFIDTLDRETAITLADFCNILYLHDTCLLERTKVPEILKVSGFFETLDDNYQKLSELTKAELMDLIKPDGKSIKYLRKSDLIAYVISSPTDEAKDYLSSLIVISAKEKYKPILVALHRYIHKLYPQYNW